MAFNISRQPLIPAFLTLTALALATVYAIGTPAGVARPGAVAERGANVWTVTGPGEGLVLEMPDAWLATIQTSFPGWSALLAGFLVLFAGMVLGRVAIRYNLYAVNTCIAIPLYGIVACGLSSGGDYLAAFTASALLTLSVKNYVRAFCNGYGFDGMFRATGYLGVLLLVFPAAAPLVFTVPLAVLLFRRTLREAIVAVAGLALPLLLLSYANWGAGGAFTAPLQQLAASCATGTPLALFHQIPLPLLLLLGAILLLDLFALALFLSDLYTVGTKPRFILIFHIGLLLLAAAILCGPAATPGAFALLSVPSAALLPVLFVRIRPWIAFTIYILLAAGAFCGVFLQ